MASIARTPALAVFDMLAPLDVPAEPELPVLEVLEMMVILDKWHPSVRVAVIVPDAVALTFFCLVGNEDRR